jgi:hypothetical protein
VGKIIENKEILRVEHASNRQHPEWKTMGVKVSLSELAILNRQLSTLLLELA